MMAAMKGGKVLILRRGKPAAVIVPADEVAPAPSVTTTSDEIAAVWESFGRGDSGSALADLLRSRGRLDSEERARENRTRQQ